MPKGRACRVTPVKTAVRFVVVVPCAEMVRDRNAIRDTNARRRTRTDFGRTKGGSVRESAVRKTVAAIIAGPSIKCMAPMPISQTSSKACAGLATLSTAGTKTPTENADPERNNCQSDNVP